MCRRTALTASPEWRMRAGRHRIILFGSPEQRQGVAVHDRIVWSHPLSSNGARKLGSRSATAGRGGKGLCGSA